MSVYSLNNLGDMVTCKFGCQKHDFHYSGAYEGALKFYGIDPKEIKPYGELINIVIFHQTSEFTVRKFSSELYNTLVDAQSEHKYFAPVADRHRRAMETLDEAEKTGLLCNEDLLKTLSARETTTNERRLYRYNAWIKRMEAESEG